MVCHRSGGCRVFAFPDVSQHPPLFFQAMPEPSLAAPGLSYRALLVANQDVSVS